MTVQWLAHHPLVLNRMMHCLLSHRQRHRDLFLTLYRNLRVSERESKYARVIPLLSESSLSPAATSPTPTTRRISLAKLIRPGFATAPSATEGSSAAVKPQRSSVHHSTEPQTMLSKTCPQTSLSETHTGRRSRQTSVSQDDNEM